MSLLPDAPEDESNLYPYVHSTVPAVPLPAETIDSVVARANDLISDHREWLANLPLHKAEAKRQAVVVPQTSSSTPTSPLNDQLARPSPLPSLEAYSIRLLSSSLSSSTSNSGLATVPASQVTASQVQASAVAAASIASLQSALNAANSALASAIQSASIALATASLSLQAALNNASIQSQSASLAIASVQANATLAIAAAQSTANASVLSANNALASVQASANAAVQNANALASGAQATATNAIAQAQATISAVASQASAAIAASRISAMNRLTFILVVTFSILGSSLLTILIFCLIARYRRKSRIKKEDELKTNIRRKRRESEESEAPSLSEFPLPTNHTQWSSAGSEDRRSGRDRSRNRSTEIGEAGYWLRGNKRVSATDRERQSWMRGGYHMADMDFPHPPPATRDTWADGPEPGERERAANRQRATEPFMGSSGGHNSILSRQTWSPSKDDRLKSQSATLVTTPSFPIDRTTPTPDGPSERPSGKVEMNATTYDPEHPDRPPKVTMWLEGSFGSVSPFPTMGAVQTTTPEVKQAVLGRQSLRVATGTGRPYVERADSDGSAIIGAAM